MIGWSRLGTKSWMEEMSDHPSTWAWSQKTKPMPKLILLALADMTGAQGESAWPSMGYLVEKTGMSRCSVIRAISSLVEAGLVVVEKRPNRSNIYQLQGYQRETMAVSERDHGSLGERPRQSRRETLTIKEPKKNQPRTKELELPIAFRTDEFRNALAGFEAMRKKIKKPLTERGLELVVAKLEGFGYADAIQALDNSTMSCWQGVFEPDKPGKTGSPGTTENKPRSAWTIRQELDATDVLITEARAHRSEVAGGEYLWDNPRARAEHASLVKQRKALNRELAGQSPKEKKPALCGSVRDLMKNVANARAVA